VRSDAARLANTLKFLHDCTAMPIEVVVLADGVAAYVTPLYEASAAGAQISLIPAWIAALGFTLQIYFDFSGYSDMALGLARFFGVRLPANFDSPLKATNIIDFWLRWHMTLTRFLTAYLFNPLVLWLTRRRLAKVRPGLGGRSRSVAAFIALLVAPTMLTMFVSGLWHGAGYLFVLWGLVHGMYLSINHGWRLFGAGVWRDKARYELVMKPLGFLLTFLAVVIAMVLFRSSGAVGARELLEGMFGLNGIALPPTVIEQLGPLSAAVRRFVLPSTEMAGQDFFLALGWIIGLLAIALLMPNTLQILDRYEPALVAGRPSTSKGGLQQLFAWTPSLPWAVAVSTLAGLTIMRLGGKSEFLYWQF